MFQNGDEVKVICGDHEGATGTIISIIKGRDLPDGAEVQVTSDVNNGHETSHAATRPA